MTEGAGHLWVTGETREARAALLRGPDPDVAVDVAVDCHRRLCGPSTGTGAVLRALLPLTGTESEENIALWKRHRKEVLAVAPELAGLVGKTPRR